MDKVLNKVIHDMKIEKVVVDGETKIELEFPPWLSKKYTKEGVDYIVNQITTAVIEEIGETPKEVTREDSIANNET